MSQLIAIASGKGGVGKTLITAALSVLLQRRGHRVLAADADMGLRNLDLLFGLDGSIHYDAAQAARGNACPARLCCRSCRDWISCRPARSGPGSGSTSRRINMSWSPCPGPMTIPSSTARPAATAPIRRRRPWPMRSCSSSNRRRRPCAMRLRSCSTRPGRSAFTTTSSSIIFTLTASSRQTQPKPVCRPATSPVSCRMMMASTGLPGKGGSPVWLIPAFLSGPVGDGRLAGNGEGHRGNGSDGPLAETPGPGRSLTGPVVAAPPSGMPELAPLSSIGERNVY